MTLANTFAAKLSVALVAVAMLFTMVTPAQAATAEELQAQIDALMAQIASLSGSTPTASADAYVFTRSLTVGSQGADVTALQNYLIGAGHAIPAGATGYFGSQTQSAVAAWQAANMISPAAGYFGPVSQAKYNELMAAGSDDDSDDDSSDDDSSDDDDSSSDLSGEASLGDTDLKDGDDTEIEEGQEAAPVAELELEFENGDAKISRIDISLVDQGTEEDPWDTFEEVSLWVDGDEVGSIDVTDEDNWLDEDLGTLRFSGLDVVSMEDETTTVVIAVTVQSSVDDMPATWDVDALNVRYVDGDDVTSTDTITEDANDFTVSAAGSDDELIVKSSSEDPAATTIQVEDDTTSDMITVFSFDMDSDDSTNDLELNDVVVGLISGTEDVEDIINDAVLIIDGEEFDDYTMAGGSTVTAALTFNVDGDYTIEAGERVTAELQVEFKKLDGVNYNQGETIQGTASGTAAWDVEGADDVTPSGSSTGDEHTLRTTGAVVEMTDATETLKENTEGSLTDDEGVFEIEFEVTAFESDLYINDDAERGTVENNYGVNYTVTSGGTASTTGTAVATLDSSAELTGGFYKVAEGETETFTLTVEFDPAGAGGAYKVRLYSVNFNTSSAANPDQQQLLTPEEDYLTSSLTI